MGGLQGELRDGGRRGLAREIEEDGCGHGVAKASRGLLSQWPIAEVCDMVNSVTPRQGYYGMMSKVGGTEGILREMRTRSLAVGCVFLCRRCEEIPSGFRLQPTALSPITPASFSALATSSLAPDPHRETTCRALVNGTSRGWTRFPSKT